MRILTTIHRAVFMLLLLVIPHVTSAQTRFKFQDSLGSYRVVFTPHVESQDDAVRYRKPLVAGTHELRLGIAYSALTASMEYTTDHWWNPHWDDAYSVGDYVVGSPSWLTFGVEGGRWYKDWLYFGGALVWSGGFSGIYDYSAYKRVDTYSYNSYSLLPVVRFAWLRRGIVQLYSGLGFGLSVAHFDRPTSVGVDVNAAFDVTFIGISVGRNLFGYFDISGGSRGAISLGVGYRFLNKNKK